VLAQRQPAGDNVGSTVSEGGRPVSTITLEERVALLEREVLQLKQQLPNPSAVPWWEQISGVFADTPAFDEAADLGHHYRASQRPAADEEADVSA
jgi:hypothetical protein